MYKIRNFIENLNLTQRNFVKSVFIYTTVTIAVIISLGVTYQHRKDYNNLSHYTNKIEDITANHEYNHKNKVNTHVLQTASQSSDPTLHAIGANYDSHHQPTKAVVKFMNAYYNWDNSSEYNNRPNKLNNIAVNKVTRNKKLFKKDKKNNISNNSYNSILDNIFLTVTQQGDTTNLLVSTHFTTWRAYQEQDQTKKYNSVQWWSIAYSNKLHKITNARKLYQQAKADSGGNTESDPATNQAGSGINY